MVVVLWVIMVLSLLISGFAFTMHVETQVASFSRKELKAEMLARSGDRGCPDAIDAAHEIADGIRV